MGVVSDLRVTTSVSLLNRCTGYSLPLYPEIHLLRVVAITPPLGIGDDPHSTSMNGAETLYVLKISRLCVLDREEHFPGPLPCFPLYLLCSLGFDSRNPREMGNVTQETQLEYRWTLHSEARSSAPYSIVCNGQSQLSGFITAVPCSSRPQGLNRDLSSGTFASVHLRKELVRADNCSPNVYINMRFHIPSRS